MASAPSAVRRRVEAVVDIGLSAKLAEPIVECRLQTALEQRLPRLHALVLIAHIFVATLQHLDQVPSELRAYRLADLIGLQRIHDLLERGHGFSWRQPAQITALRRAGVFGVTLGQISKIL